MKKLFKEALKASFIAEQMNVNRFTFYKKLGGEYNGKKYRFTRDEKAAIARALKLLVKKIELAIHQLEK